MSSPELGKDHRYYGAHEDIWSEAFGQPSLEREQENGLSSEQKCGESKSCCCVSLSKLYVAKVQTLQQQREQNHQKVLSFHLSGHTISFVGQFRIWKFSWFSQICLNGYLLFPLLVWTSSPHCDTSLTPMALRVVFQCLGQEREDTPNSKSHEGQCVVGQNVHLLGNISAVQNSEGG